MKTTDQLYYFFSSEFPFNVDGLNEFVDSFEATYYKRGDIILKNNSIENKLRFLDKGIVREFYNHERKEVNIGFYTKPEFISDFTSLTKDKKTTKNQECLSDVQLRSLSKNKFENFLEKYSCGRMFIQEIFRQIISAKEQEYYNQAILSPDELYRNLFLNKPEWLQKIPLYHLASYLRVTPETLSRIRKRIYES